MFHLIPAGTKITESKAQKMILDAEFLRMRLIKRGDDLFAQDPKWRVYRKQIVDLLSDHNGYLANLRQDLNIAYNQSQAV
jgi:hypothetical protein